MEKVVVCFPPSLWKVEKEEIFPSVQAGVKAAADIANEEISFIELIWDLFH